MARKVKTGCRTCKVRKVKCDERWPACRRCQSTGRKCDGYGIWGGGSQANDLDASHVSSNGENAQARRLDIAKSIPRSPEIILLQTSEQECFEWYLRRSASKLAGVFPSEYWKATLVQASITEPAVRHALLALSSAHKEEVSGINVLGQMRHSKQALFTMSQYSKALTHVQNCTGDSKLLMRVALIACVLFFTTEFLRGHYTSGILHMESGLRLLRSTVTNEDGLDPALLGVDGWLITMFTRSLVHAKLLRSTSISDCGGYIDLAIHLSNDIFLSTHQARRLLEHIQLRALDLQQKSSLCDSDSMTKAELFGEQSQLKNALHFWFDTYQRTTKLVATSLLERLAYTVLKIHYHMVYVLVGVCLEPANELLHDEYNPIYERLVCQCTEFYIFLYETAPTPTFNAKNHRDPESTSPNSTADIGWISPLFFTALKCRSPHLRHQALALLQKSPHKEGIWDSCLAAVVAKEVISVEESSHYGESVDEFKLTLEADNQSSVLPLSQRISNIAISLPSDRLGRLLLTYDRRCTPDGPSKYITSMKRVYDLHLSKWIE